MSVAFEGTYANETKAEGASSSMHADYNIYMGKTGVDAENYTPVFNYIDSRAKYNLYTKASGLRASTYGIFLIGDHDAELTLDSLQSVYRSEGFSCEITEKNNK